jgi:hypothetical protein
MDRYDGRMMRVRMVERSSSSAVEELGEKLAR